MTGLPLLPPEPALLAPGQRLARGVARGLRALDFASVEEVVLASGLRADLMAIGPRGEIWIVECKSSRSDFVADRKWQGYRAYCDRFFFAVGPDFPAALVPEDCGLILGDDWDAEVVRICAAHPLAGARRKAVTQSFARQAALRLQRLRDPAP